MFFSGYIKLHDYFLRRFTCSTLGKKSVRDGDREVENGKGGGSDKQQRYSPDGRELDLYHLLCKCGVKHSDRHERAGESGDRQRPLPLSSYWLHFTSLFADTC